MHHYAVQPTDTPGHWIVNFTKYIEHTRDLVQELEALVPQLQQLRPVGAGPELSSSEVTPEIRALCRRRDRLNDSVKVFSAMAVESFLNLYGVIRLGESVYMERFERLGPVRKLRCLLAVCESLKLKKSDPLRKVATAIGSRRNGLVHPPAREYDSAKGPDQTHSDLIPDAAHSARNDLVAFFNLFQQADPRANRLVKLALEAT